MVSKVYTHQLIVSISDPSRQISETARSELGTGKGGKGGELTSAKERSLAPVHGEQDPRAEADALCEVDAAPEIDGEQAPAETQAAKVKDGRVAHVREGAHVAVGEGLEDGVVEVAVVDLVGPEARQGDGHLVEFLAEVLALLVGALGRGGERGELRVDLDEEFVQLAKVEGAALVLVVLLEQPVQALQVARSLREALSHASCDVAPFLEGDLELVRVLALLPRHGAQEGGQVVGDVVLDGGAVADGVDVAERRAEDAQVRVGLERVPVVLRVAELLGDLLAQFRLRDAGRPETKAHRKFFGHGLAILDLGKDDLVRQHFFDARIGQDFNRVMGEALLGVLGESFVVGIEDVAARLDNVD